MKTRLSENGELEISENSRQMLICAIVFVVIAIAADAFHVWASFDPELSSSPSGTIDLLIDWLGNLGAIGMVVWTFWFLPFRRTFILANQTVSIVDRLVFKSRTVTYPVAEVDHFGFSYFEQYRATRPGALIRMHLRSGQEVRLMKLQSVAQCKVAHAAMDAYFTAHGQQELVYELPGA